MGLKILLGIVWLSVCGLPRFGDCQPKWQKTDQNNKPYNGQKVYADRGSSFTFDWRYDSAGYSRQYTKWEFTKSTVSGSKLVATKQGEQIPVEFAPFKGKLSFQSGASLELKSLKYPEDEGKYECDLTFSSGNSGASLDDFAELIVVVPPIITGKMSGSTLTIPEQETRTLKCAASGNPKPKIRWTRKDLDTNVITTVMDDYNHYGYNITNAQRKDIGLYTCEAIISVNGGRIEHKVSYSLTVYVKYKPEVTELTGNRTLTEGSKVELVCKAKGDPKVTGYHWYKSKVQVANVQKGIPSTEITGGNAKYTITTESNMEKSTLEINNLNRIDADWYFCAAKNDLGIGNGTGTYVSARFAPTKVQITYIPKQTVNLTQAVTLKCISDGVPNPSFTWKFKEKDLDSKLQVIKGKNNELVEISRMTRELTGEYTCKASNPHGDSSTKDTLNVNYKPTTAYFTTGLPNLGLLLNSRSSLRCESDGYPKPQYIIKKYEGGTLKETSKDKDRIEFQSVKLDDEKFEYTCTPFNFLGQGPETAKAKVTVIVRPSFIQGLNPSPKLTRTENQTQNYTCIVDAKPVATITWLINNENVTLDKPYLGVPNTKFSGSKDNPGQFRTESKLVISSLTWRQDGNVSCVASNGADPVTTYALLEVRHRPVVKNPDEVPNNKTVNTGDDVTFTCFAVGKPAIESYKWKFKKKVISGATSRTYTIRNVDGENVGKYSCLGKNSLGEGPWFPIELFIKTRPRITSNFPVEADPKTNVVLSCKASGIPSPVISWYRNNRYLGKGENLNLYNVTYEDRGHYECRAKNELAEDKAVVVLSIRVKPNITTNKPTDTQVAGIIGNDSTLHCKVIATPPAVIWFTRGNENAELKTSDERIVSISSSTSAKSLKLKVDRIGEEYYCHAKNPMGYAKQKYTIRPVGRPDPPIDLKLYTIKLAAKRTVNVNVTWVAGYSGGQPQFFTILYRLFSANGFSSVVLDRPDITNFVINDLSPLTKYAFQLTARNGNGQSNPSTMKIYTTEASALPPARGSLIIKRIQGGTVVRISWTAQDNVTAIYIQYREVKLMKRARRNTDNYEYGRWNNVEGAQGLSKDRGSFDVVNLDEDKTYQFRILFKVGNEIGFNDKMIVDSEIIQPLLKPGKRTGLKEDELIAIIAACGGFLLIVIVVVCLCCFMKRKKGYGADSVQMSQTGSAPNLLGSVYDTGARGTNRYATSVEDDPFIDAHIANELNKKRRPENGINHGYASQGIRTGISQSVGELGPRTSSYSSTGPQRDFSTLPPYHEPPSFEEAIRQSVKKSKYAALSTGDLTEEPRVHHGRSRGARTPDSDTSDSEPPLNRRPMFKVKPPVPPHNDKRYRSAPSIPPLASPVRTGPPRDLYARPQKKGPPPSYTPDDRAVIPGMEDDYEPRVTKRRPIADDVMELQEQPSYHRNDRLPDLPPSMPEFSRSRGTMQKEPLGETLPEPPSFLRDLSYEDDEPDGRYTRSYTEPRNRNKQPYVNIHGQLVRPNSPGRQPTYGSDRQEPIYANDPPRLVAAEPEVPVERRNRQPPGNDEHKPGYVSSGFLV